MRNTICTSLCILIAFAGAGVSAAQSTELALGPDSKLWIDGTSNKSDWTVTATDISGNLLLNEDGYPSQATVVVTAETIESNKSKIMDRLMYRALKVQAHPDITYTLTASDPPMSDSVMTTGEVRVAGVTRSASMHVLMESREDGTVRVVGSHPMKMTDHGMKPPTAMFGALHTGNEVTVHFDVVFVPDVTATDS